MLQDLSAKARECDSVDHLDKVMKTVEDAFKGDPLGAYLNDTPVRPFLRL